jgi:hypothetical protein
MTELSVDCSHFTTSYASTSVIFYKSANLSDRSKEKQRHRQSVGCTKTLHLTFWVIARLTCYHSPHTSHCLCYCFVTYACVNFHSLMGLSWVDTKRNKGVINLRLWSPVCCVINWRLSDRYTYSGLCSLWVCVTTSYCHLNAICFPTINHPMAMTLEQPWP